MVSIIIEMILIIIIIKLYKYKCHNKTNVII